MMNSALTFNQMLTNSDSHPFFEWNNAATAISQRNKYNFEPSTKPEPQTFTTKDQDLLSLQALILQAKSVLFAKRVELETPEVFELPALSRTRIEINIRNIEPGAFYFVQDDNLELQAIEG